MGRLFGTDGARGVANSELTCELAMEIGRAAAMILIGDKQRPRVLIGKDTRISSDMLESAIAAGLCSVGADVVLLGVSPTPAVAFLVSRSNFDAGIMISASHNPCEYNGIKIFKSDGYKLPDALEEKIEEIILDDVAVPQVKIGGEVGTVSSGAGLLEQYIEHIRATAHDNFSGFRFAFDCANGSASVTAHSLFNSLGAECSFISDNPDGININHECGSTHLDALRAYVLENKLDAGFAFDGDADRLLAVDSFGETVDGDQIIAMCADFLKQRGELPGNTAVVTVMSNMGFYSYCNNHDINYVTTKVGDRYVLEKMVECGYALGGEQSGHVIFSQFANTGDGQLTAVQVMNVMRATGKSLHTLSHEMEIYPQIMINVRVSDLGKARLATDSEIQRSVAEAEKELGDTGRVLVRVSGTEPLVRVMLEGKDEQQINRLGNEIAGIVAQRLL